MFATRIKELRTKKGWSQKKLAELLFVDQTAISYWENGKTFPDYNKQQALADLFDVSIDYLTGRSDENSSPSPSEDDIKVALFGGDKEVTDEMWQEVLGFVDYVKAKHRSEDEKK